MIHFDAAIAAALEALPGTARIAYNAPGGRSWVVVDQYSGRPLIVQSSRTSRAGTWTMSLN